MITADLAVCPHCKGPTGPYTHAGEHRTREHHPLPEGRLGPGACHVAITVVEPAADDLACAECEDVGWVEYDGVDYPCIECLRVGRIRRDETRVLL